MARERTLEIGATLVLFGGGFSVLNSDRTYIGTGILLRYFFSNEVENNKMATVKNIYVSRK
jgi:hypothetical protein